MFLIFVVFLVFLLIINIQIDLLFVYVSNLYSVKIEFVCIHTMNEFYKVNHWSSLFNLLILTCSYIVKFSPTYRIIGTKHLDENPLLNWTHIICFPPDSNMIFVSVRSCNIMPEFLWICSVSIRIPRSFSLWFLFSISGLFGATRHR